MIEPIVKEVTVPVDTGRAFQVFTEQFGDWWPVASHSLSASDGKRPKRVTMTPGTSGAIIEELHDGSTANWGLVTAWEPGKLLSFTWHLRRPTSQQTDIIVEFFPEGETSRIRLVHQGWEAMGKDGANAREQYLSGWDIVVARYVAAASAYAVKTRTDHPRS